MLKNSNNTSSERLIRPPSLHYLLYIVPYRKIVRVSLIFCPCGVPCWAIVGTPVEGQWGPVFFHIQRIGRFYPVTSRLLGLLHYPLLKHSWDGSLCGLCVKSDSNQVALLVGRLIWEVRR
jgi:hypothetical protein